MPSHGNLFYSVDLANLHLVVLDPWKDWMQETCDVNHVPWQRQLAWLKKDLAATDQEWIVVLNHFPVYCDGNYQSDQEPLKALRECVVPLLDQYGVTCSSPATTTPISGPTCCTASRARPIASIRPGTSRPRATAAKRLGGRTPVPTAGLCTWSAGRRRLSAQRQLRPPGHDPLPVAARHASRADRARQPGRQSTVWCSAAGRWGWMGRCSIGSRWSTESPRTPVKR